MKIVVIFGSHRKTGQTVKVCKLFESEIKKMIEADFEYVFLKDAKLNQCIGCVSCLQKGEETCPFKDDDRDMILKKMDEADGIVFASSNYALNVTALAKNFFDRTAFIYHRPRFFHKVITGIVTQGIYGGNDIVKYFKITGSFWGGMSVPGISLTIASGAYDIKVSWTKNEKRQIDKKVKKLASAYVKCLNGNRSPVPSLLKLFIFRSTRTFHRFHGQVNKDFNYFQEKGWFDSDYYYPVKLGLFKRMVGKMVDALNRKTTLKAKEESLNLKNTHEK